MSRGDGAWKEIRRKYKLETDALMHEWNRQLNVIASKTRARLTELIKQKGYDGLIIRKDEGSFGRATETIIALSPNQIKLASSISNNSDETNEEFYKGITLPKSWRTSSGEYVEVFKNPSKRELDNLLKEFKDLRFVVSKDKNLFVWNAEALHADVLSGEMDGDFKGHIGRHYITLYMYPSEYTDEDNWINTFLEDSGLNEFGYTLENIDKFYLDKTTNENLEVLPDKVYSPEEVYDYVRSETKGTLDPKYLKGRIGTSNYILKDIDPRSVKIHNREEVIKQNATRNLVVTRRTMPIVVGEDGYIIDGRHRSIRAMAQGLVRIKALVPIDMT